jgi:hypothetical protein
VTERPTEVRERRTSARWALALIAAGVASLSGAGSAWAARNPVTLVVCAPGYPGSTAEAQSAMDTLAAAVTAAADWQPGELKAVYYETEQAGLVRLDQADAALALVPLPFWLKHRAALGLAPQLQAIQQGGEAAEVWSLVAPLTAGARPADLAGYEILSVAGYAPRFVLPYATRLKVIARSRPLPVSVLCAVEKRLPAARLATVLEALTSLASHAGGTQALAAVRMKAFVAADQRALTAARAAFERAGD